MRSGLRIHRDAESLVQHAPPMLLGQCDVMLVDERSEYDNGIAGDLIYAVNDLPQMTFVAAGVDYKQLQPVTRGGEM